MPAARDAGQAPPGTVAGGDEKEGVMRTLGPWNGMTHLRKEVDRLFDRMWEGEPELASLGEWKPALDLKETKDFLVVTAEMPGMDPKDIKVTVREGILTIEGEKKQQEEEKDEKHYRMERSFGSFVRSVRLPLVVDSNKVAATFKNGLIEVKMPKLASTKETTIPIKTE
jgi:HSP20 family protein